MDGAAMLAVLLALVLGVGIYWTVSAVRKALSSPSPRSSARRRAREPMPRSPLPAPQPAQEPLGELVIRCARRPQAGGDLVVLIANQGKTATTVQHLAVLFWPDSDGRWSWRNAPPLSTTAGHEPPPLPHQLRPGEELALPLAREPLLHLVEEALPAGSEGFGFRVFTDSGQTVDSPLIHVDRVDSDCPIQSRPMP